MHVCEQVGLKKSGEGNLVWVRVPHPAQDKLTAKLACNNL
jgi:hypothetical protein